MYRERAKKGAPYNLLLITHQRFKILLQNFAADVLNVYMGYGLWIIKFS